MRNKICLKGLLAVALFSATTFAHALVVDTLLGKTNNANSGGDTELAGLKLVLADYNMTALTPILLTGSLLLEKSADINIGTIQRIGDTFFYNVAPATPSFFLLKFGGGNNVPAPAIKVKNKSTSVKDSTFTDYYFANIDDLSRLVFTNAQFDNGINFADCIGDGSCRLSHYTLFNSPPLSTSTQPIPEPALPLLLGVGLVGFYLARRTRRA